MVESKFYQKKKQKNESSKIKKYINQYIIKVLITVVVLLILLIGFKWTQNFKQQFNKAVYHTNFSFSQVKEFYQKHFGEDLISKNIEKEALVFEEKLTYSKESLYQDGVALSVKENYMIPSLESGIVVFIGKKDQYNQTIIVQGMNGVDVWYGNLESENVKLYDYVEKGSLIGQTKDNTLYLAFQKEGKFVNYKDYLSKN